MKQIDRLTIAAKRIAGLTGKQLELARIELTDGGWVLFAHVWDGVVGNAPVVERSSHATMDAAIESVHALAGQYPNSRDITILIDDI